jgi:hypothetical protein
MPRHTRNNNNTLTAPLLYPKFTKEDRFQISHDQAIKALHKSIDFSNQRPNGWDTIRIDEVLSDAQKALLTMNAELASFLLLRDNLEVAVMNLTRAKEAAAAVAEAWGTSQEN